METAEILKQWPLDDKPTLTIVITQNEYRGEYTLSEPIFNSFEEANEALKKFIQSYSS